MSRVALLLLVGSVLHLHPTLAQVVPDSGEVVINEIQYAPSPATNEYIELYNRSDTPVDLSALEYADDNGDFAAVTTRDTTLPPDGYAVLVRDPAAFEAAFPSVEYLAPDGWAPLNNGGDVVQIRLAGSTTLLDAVPYVPSWGGRDGRSLERIDPAGPSDRSENFATSEAPLGGTPGDQNSQFAPDTMPPTLEGVLPTADGDSVTAIFSEPLDASTVSADAFALEGPAASTIRTAALIPGDPSAVRCALTVPLPEGSFVLAASGLADRRGNTQAETRAPFDFVPTAPPQAGDIVVTELMYAPAPGASEFIEIYNRSADAVDLQDVTYADENQDFAPVAQRWTPLRPNAHAVLVRDSLAFATTFPEVSFLVPDGWNALNNGGDRVSLRHQPSGTLLDQVPYRPSWGGRNGRSLERIDPAGPPDDPANFGTSEAPSGATPGERNSLFDPDRSPPAPFFAEQVASARAEVHFSEPVRASTVTADAFTIDGRSVESARLAQDSVALLTFPGASVPSRLTVSGVEDRTGNALEQADLPLALRPAPSQVAVNEVMYAPRADDFDDRPNQVEYVELVNRTADPLTLNGLFLTDRPNERGTADTLRAGRLRLLPPDGYALVTAAPRGPTTPSASQLAAAFPEAPLESDSTAFLPVPTPTLGLVNDGDLVRAHRADGTVLTEARYSPDWHAEALEDPKGTALERISVSGRSSAADNWTSSVAPLGGTPGAQNSVGLSRSEAPTSERGLDAQPSPFSVERDGATRIRYRLDQAPTLIRVRIYDARGREVRRLEESRLAGRDGSIVWNGQDDRGNAVRIGVYVVHLEAVRAGDGTVTQLKDHVVVGRPLD